MKNYVQIQSTIDVLVTAGLQYTDVTNEDAHVADRLRVQSDWPRLTVMIKKGQHWYPSEIAEWPTVKSLQKDRALTIGTFSDEPNEEGVDKEKATLKENQKRVEDRERAAKNQNL